MTDKIEQVARALAKQDALEHRLSGPLDWQLYRQNARVVIEVIREVIIQAVRDAPALDENGYIATKESILREIDAALKGDA